MLSKLKYFLNLDIQYQKIKNKIEASLKSK